MLNAISTWIARVLVRLSGRRDKFRTGVGYADELSTEPLRPLKHADKQAKSRKELSSEDSPHDTAVNRGFLANNPIDTCDATQPVKVNPGGSQLPLDEQSVIRNSSRIENEAEKSSASDPDDQPSGKLIVPSSGTQSDKRSKPPLVEPQSGDSVQFHVPLDTRPPINFELDEEDDNASDVKVTQLESTTS